MVPLLLFAAAALLIVLVVAAVLFTRRTVRWGATAEECSMPMPGDEYFTGDSLAFVAMTRAVTIAAAPETVWPWLAQLGRGAGWYSVDRLDNGGKVSARHIISWVPSPQEGDATAIGYLRRVTPGRELSWWVPGVRFLGTTARLAVDIRLAPENGGSRLVIRMSGDAAGGMPRLVLGVFRFIDSVMARRQLLGIKERVERHGVRTSDPQHPETGAPDQYQLYEVIYASGQRAGVPGKELAERWQRAALEAGVMSGEGQAGRRDG
ncbi:MAG TPA: SRPBCC family protein [Gemmatimonadota bacterium]|nr:SRPBCC family protein [Gemmatimonadota bacterium]